jgi:hypothetical protein
LRAFIRIRLTRISDSCGFGVPVYEFRGERSQLKEWAERKGEDTLAAYRQTKNSCSIDGLPGALGPKTRNQNFTERRKDQKFTEEHKGHKDGLF